MVAVLADDLGYHDSTYSLIKKPLNESAVQKFNFKWPSTKVNCKRSIPAMIDNNSMDKVTLRSLPLHLNS